jgi:UDP-N-acetylmuramyl pentapeptide synthase
MLRAIKRALYFPIAGYFRFWAGIQLALWKPKIIVVTGSSGKTTLLHLIESQIGDKAKYSHRANSSYGIPFDILGLTRKKLTYDEWLSLFLLAPFKAFKNAPKERIYVVEGDCDRPHEGKFLAKFLKPDITLFVNLGITHSANFDSLVCKKAFNCVEKAIAHEFGYFPEYTKELVIATGDNQLVQEELKRSKAKTILISKKDLNSYKITVNSTEFVIDHKKYSFNYLLPEEIFYSVKMTGCLLQYLNFSFDSNFKNFKIPPGRNSVLKGIKNSRIIDSTYNATPDGVKIILRMYKRYPAKNKWIALGDMIELGHAEEQEHEDIAYYLKLMDLSKIILIGPRVLKYLYPKIKQEKNIFTFLTPGEGLDYIQKNICGGETILFKGARFLEGIIERILQNSKDAAKLVRREKAWQNRRKAWNL